LLAGFDGQLVEEAADIAIRAYIATAFTSFIGYKTAA